MTDLQLRFDRIEQTDTDPKPCQGVDEDGRCQDPPEWVMTIPGQPASGETHYCSDHVVEPDDHDGTFITTVDLDRLERGQPEVPA